MSEEGIPFVGLSQRQYKSKRGLLAIVWEIVTGGITELWIHKLRTILMLTLLMLGVFSLVVLTSVLDGVVDKITSGFAGMSWDGTLILSPKNPRTAIEQQCFSKSPGLRVEDVARLTVPHEKIMAFMPRASKLAHVRIASVSLRTSVIGITPNYLPVMNREIVTGRGLTEDDQKYGNTVAVIGSTMAASLMGGVDPVGKDLLIDGIPFHIVGILSPLQIFNDDAYMDANGVLVPIKTYMDRLGQTHRLDYIAVKLFNAKDMAEVSNLMLNRVRQSHHGIEDVEFENLDARAAKNYNNFLKQIHNWRTVVACLAGTVLLVGGVGVLSIMLISSSERRYEIGLRKAVGATDKEIFLQFLLEAVVLAVLGAVVGSIFGTIACHTLSSRFPYGMVVNPFGLLSAWLASIAFSIIFGMYPAIRVMRLSPMEAMR